MATGLNKVVEHLRRALAPAGGDLTDGQLLARFLASRDEAAFAALVRRHGRLVLGVCRRVLGHEQDAEDCFQATFLVLARRAGAIRKRDALASWLYGVAYRVAREARAVNLRRRARERQVEDMPHPEVQPAQPQDWRPLLDRELSALPEKYRAPLVLCDLEGRSRKEAAQQLGVPEGTLSSRLTRARALLAKRLARCGVSLSGAALAALAEGAWAAVPASLLGTTVKVAAGRALTAGAVSAKVLALTEGVMKAMLLTKLKAAAGVVLLAVCLGAGAAYRATATEQSQAAERPEVTRSVENDLEALRLEVEALRRGLQATRERVKALETEVQALRPRGGAKADMGGKTGMPRMMGGAGFAGGMPGRFQGGGGFPGGAGMRGGYPGDRGGYPGDRGGAKMPAEDNTLPRQSGQKARPKEAADPTAEGLVSKVDPSGLVSLTIGSDAGLSKGNTLEVMRYDPTPRYLGTLRVLEVTPHQAIAQPVGRLSASLQVGDRVTSRSALAQPGQKARPKETADPIAEAEAALKKLRQDPSDKQATESLERALKRLKEQRKRDPELLNDP